MSRRNPERTSATRPGYILAGLVIWILVILSFFAEGALLARPDLLATAAGPCPSVVRHATPRLAAD
jgi:hypothetical protein